MNVEVKFFGSIEVPTKRGYEWVNGYVVVVDGREQYPALPYRKAQALAKQIRKEL